MAADSRDTDSFAEMGLLAATTARTVDCWPPPTNGQEMDKEEADSSQIACF